MYYLGHETNPYLVLVKAKSNGITTCQINENCKIILENAFERCEKLISITIPDSIVRIGKGAFYFCSGLESIIVSKDVLNIIIPGSNLNIGNIIFKGCEKISNIYYTGTLTEWNDMTSGIYDSYLANLDVYYYSEIKPVFSNTKSWHYVDGVPTIWE